MNLEQTKETIQAWIKSCTSAQQLDLIIEVISRFIILRFEDINPAWELEVAKNDLMEVWTTQAAIIASTQQTADLAPTLAVYEQTGAFAD